jgi:ferritin
MKFRRVRNASVEGILEQTNFMSDELNDLLSKQVIHELSSAYLYFAMSAKCGMASFHGFEKFFYKKAKEEIYHANKVKKALIDMNKPITFYSIPSIDYMGTDLLEMFNQFLAAEKKVTAQWLLIKETCENDDVSASVVLSNLIDWFLAEQIEEENEASDLLTLITKSKGNMASILAIESRLVCDNNGFLDIEDED